MKIKIEAMVTPLRSLPRSASGRADPPSPFSYNPAHHPVSTPTTPAAASASSFGCMTATPTDTPPATPKAALASAAASYVALWSPRKLMQRAARAFRTSSRSRRRMKVAGDEPVLVTSKGSDAPTTVSLGAELPADDAQGGAFVAANTQEEHHNLEAVPEKIIHEANHQAPAATEPEVCEKTADGKENGAVEEEEEDEPKKAAAPAPPPDAAADANADADANVTDKFMVMKEAIRKREAEAETKKEAMRRFQGSRVKTAMEARPESEQPRRREVARSNDVIEDARSKLLDKQCSRVKALVGAFETVMDAKHAGGGKPQHHHRESA